MRSSVGFLGLAAWAAGCSGAMDAGAGTSADVDAAPVREVDSSADSGARDKMTVADAKQGADTGRADRSGDKAAEADVYYPPVTCAGGLLFCEDFEYGALDPTRWMTGTKAGTTTIESDSARAFQGKRSLRFRIVNPMGERGGFVQTVAPFALAGKRLFVRYFMYIDTLTPNRWFWIWSATAATPWVFDRVANAKPECGMNLAPESEFMPTGKAVFEPGCENQNQFVYEDVPLGRWACWEYELHGDDGGRMTLTIDGKPVPGIDLAWPTPPAPRLAFGVYNSHDDTFLPKPNGFNVWIDAVAVSTERIGCNP